MYAFVADQVLGINGLVNLSNIVFLAAYSVRDVLMLRILSIVGEGLILPYYYFQDEKLWPPIFWGAAFMTVNAIRIVAMALERRPVVLSDKESQLYRVAFSSIEKREFLRLVSLARWVDCSPGEVILEKGQHISDAIVVIVWGPRSHSQRQHQNGDSTRSAHRGRERLQRLGQPGGRGGARSRNSCKMGPAAYERVHGEQTRTPRQPSADCEHGSCRQTARCRDRRSGSRCGNTRVEAIPERRIVPVRWSLLKPIGRVCTQS